MATTKTTGQLPAGFVSPYKRVAMEERIDDSLACIATLTNQSLADIKKLAFQLGFPKQGPAWVSSDLIAQLLYQHGLIGKEYQEVSSTAALPDVAILLVDYNADTEIGRHVVWHHLRGTPERQAFSYLVDVASWLPVEQQVTTDFTHLQMNPPQYYIEITPRPDGSHKRK
jgi:hypothetical protein